MKPIEIIRGGWFVLCATGAFVGTLFPATVVAAAILLGMILLVIVSLWLVAAKDLDWRFTEAQRDGMQEAGMED